MKVLYKWHLCMTCCMMKWQLWPSNKLIKVMLHFKGSNEWGKKEKNEEVSTDRLQVHFRLPVCQTLQFYAPFAFCSSFLSLSLSLPLHMSMAFLWQTFYLHLVKWRNARRLAVCSTKHNAADGRVCVCGCLPQM